MATRTVAGDSIYLYVKTATSPSATWTVWGCMESFTFTSSVESFEINCRAFSGKIPSGKAASWSISTGGFYRIFDSTDEATNISVKDSYNYHKDKNVIEVKFGTVTAGDPIWIGKAFISQFELNGDQGGAAKYSLTLEGSEPITIDEAA